MREVQWVQSGQAQARKRKLSLFEIDASGFNEAAS